MRRRSWNIKPTGIFLLVTALVGCTTTQDQVAIQFEPVPIVEVGEQELEPVPTRTVSDLLRSANDAFRAANTAQETGDHEASLRNYTLMLELLLEADLDPAIFYNLRSEFRRILDSSTQLARNYESTSTPRWAEEALAAPSKSDLEYPYPLPERVLIEIEQIEMLYAKHYEAGLSRSAKYLPYIHAEFAKAGLPRDLAWLAMVESQFTPKIVSRAGAGGMWQFMRSTGRRYGLRIDGTIDERYDWQKSTQAAIAYLTELHDVFDGSWPLAVSAYNMGERGLERAIALNGGDRDLWRLIETPPAANRIRRETKKFYPKLLATAIVAKNPGRYGIVAEPEKPDECTRITVKGSYSLHDLEKQVGLPRDTLRSLNPQLIQGYTPFDGECDVMVPVKSRAQIAAALKRMPKLSTGTHVVQRGETPGGIARRYKVSVHELMRVNNVRSANRLQIGQRLVLPGRAGVEVRTASARSGGKTYTVRRGDSLSKIAARHRVSVRELQRWNNLGRRTRIHVGDWIKVGPQSAPPVSAPRESQVVHVVRAGEFPAKIARRYQVKLDDFLAWNGLTRTSTIRVGDKLKVYNLSTTAPAESRRNNPPKPVEKSSPPKGLEKKIHRVTSGENPSVIAARYGANTRDFLKWNNLTTRSVLQVGDEYAVYVPSRGPDAEPKRVEMAESPTADSKSASRKVTHVVRRGQNPSTIAKRYGVKVGDLFVLNGWKKGHVLHIGDEITISGD